MITDDKRSELKQRFAKLDNETKKQIGLFVSASPKLGRNLIHIFSGAESKFREAQDQFLADLEVAMDSKDYSAFDIGGRKDLAKQSEKFRQNNPPTVGEQIDESDSLVSNHHGDNGHGLAPQAVDEEVEVEEEEEQEEDTPPTPPPLPAATPQQQARGQTDITQMIVTAVIENLVATGLFKKQASLSEDRVREIFREESKKLLAAQVKSLQS